MYDCLRVARRITSDLLFDLLRRCKMKSIPTWIPSSDRVQRCRGKCVYHWTCPFLAAAQTVGFLGAAAKETRRARAVPAADRAFVQLTGCIRITPRRE